MEQQREWLAGRLTTSPGKPRGERLPAGLHWLGSAALMVPEALPDGPVPLVILLHGATSNPRQALPYMQEEAAARGFLVLVPKSQDYTWDVIRGGFGPDVKAIDGHLAEVYDLFQVDPARLAIAGFSDGASYALSLGLVNGLLFTHVLAYSPGFMVWAARQGHPKVFISHGTDDQILPIDRCSRRLVPLLEGAGYDVEYHEFTGGHVLREELVAAATDLFLT